MIKEPFYDAEEVVQWVSDSNRMRGAHVSNRVYDRPCEVSDILIVAKRLKTTGKINTLQYVMFNKMIHGELEYIPDRLYGKWKDFLSKLDMALRAKQIIVGGAV